MLSKDHLSAFGQHLSSVIPLLLSLAGDRGGGDSGRGGGGGGGVGDGGSGRGSEASAGGIGAMGRFRALECLTTVASLPYSRLHPFKTQVCVFRVSCVCLCLRLCKT